MTRVLWDSVTPANAMGTALFAGYADGPRKWPDDDLALCFLTISINSVFLDADVLDVETGDATPAHAVNWVKGKRARGDVFIGLYCNWSTLPDVVAAFGSAGVSLEGVMFWIARYNGDPAIPTFPGVIIFAHQWQNTLTKDVSSVIDFIPGLDVVHVTSPTPADVALAVAQYKDPATQVDANQRWNDAALALAAVNKLATAVAALDTKVSGIVSTLATADLVQLQSGVNTMIADVGDLRTAVAAIPTTPTTVELGAFTLTGEGTLNATPSA